MFRSAFASSVVLAAVAAPAPAQIGNLGGYTFNSNAPPAGQFFNGGVPIAGFVPGLNFAPGNTVTFGGPRGTSLPFNYGGFGAPYGQPYSPYGMFAYDSPLNGAYYAPYYMAFTTPLPSNDFPPPPLQFAGPGSVVNVKLQGSPATLDIQFPADADVWLNGKRVEGTAARKREFASPSIKPGEEYTFDLRAEWVVDGKSYEYARSLKVPSGDRSKVTVVSGTPKPDGARKER